MCLWERHPPGCGPSRHLPRSGAGLRWAAMGTGEDPDPQKGAGRAGRVGLIG
jgi:hypothetical protein